EREQVSREGFLGGQAVPPPVTGGRSGAMCGPYVLEALIGRGGMGSVWRGRRTDGRYDATVAIKLLSSPMLGADGEKRFRREGQILARLRHPNIAQLLDAGISDDGQPFLALEYVEGEHLDQWADARGLSVRERVRLFLDVLRAVAHAHTNLVVHRDLKPSNILVDADGRVVLLDFGIAKLITDEEGGPVATQLTREGAQVLTPRYAAPEQVTGGEVTTATDVYALGVVLCELLSGESPYRTPRASVGALEDAIVTGDPVRPSDLAPVVRRKVLRGDLDTIVLKALRKIPSERYATVTALADDLEAWLDGRPVRARPDAFGYRAARFVRRHALAVGATAAVFVAVLGGAGVALWQARVARAEAERAEEITNFITGIFREADPYERSEATLTAPELLQQAYARVQTSFADRPTLRFELTWLIGSSLANLQEYAAAEPVLFDAAAQADSLFATTDPERLKAQAALGGLMRYRGQLDRMDSLLTATLVTLRGMPEPPLPLLVTTLVDSAHLAIDRGNAPAAIAPARAADSLAAFFQDSALDQRVAAAQVLAIAL
ncbi:MAG TPA: serine/threonine-protein kinase, partial [Gemmatimonadaceae bacterium]|nr:serine/threonine-protein kinase [Gemmatimonadaceae bacterium]